MAYMKKEELEQQRSERLGAENYNTNGELMKVVEYMNSHNVVVEFQDELKLKKTVYWKSFLDGEVKNPKIYKRNGLEKLNNQGSLMKIVEYNGRHDVIVEFQDEFKACVHSDYGSFEEGGIKNPYFPEVHGVGMIGTKYSSTNNGTLTKEYRTWWEMLRRCYDLKYKEKEPAYKDVACCKEWLLYENFYEWLHSQENFEEWVKTKRSALDKDILIKHNKIYSPETCTLVPQQVNTLFVKRDTMRGELPIGVIFYKPYKKYRADCHMNGRGYALKYCDTVEEAFQVYKEYKEKIIKQTAQEEYEQGSISKKCYDAMMKYEVEITD